MTVTGYEYQKNDRHGKHTVGVCPDCLDDFGLEPFNDKYEGLREHNDTMFRHGSGDPLPCIGCGFDINDSLAGRALRDKTDRELVTVPTEDRPTPPFPALAGLLTKADSGVYADVIASIALAPGEEPEEIHHLEDDEGNAIAKTVRHPDDATETLQVMIDRYKSDEDRQYTAEEQEARAERIARLLKQNGLRVHYYPANPDEKSEEWSVKAAAVDA